MIVRMDTWTVTVSDPTQQLSSVTITLTLGSGSTPEGWTGAKTIDVAFDLPSGGVAGASVSKGLFS